MTTQSDFNTTQIESRYAWLRLGIALLLGTIGGVGMWSVVVVLPTIQTEFGIARADASLPYTLTMLGFGVGGVIMGRIADRFGIVVTIFVGVTILGAGYIGVRYTTSILQLAIVHGLMIGIGSATTFGPLMADISHWFARRRGIAISICASGNYLAGTVWPSIVQHFTASIGWRDTYTGIGIFCIVTMLPLALCLRRGAETHASSHAEVNAPQAYGSLGLTPNALQAALALAGLACCVAMSMPQVHIVAYCGDLGYGVANGKDMLSLMLGMGIVSRVASGWIADRIGGLPTLMLGSALQGFALVLYLMFDGLTSLYMISALFGLFQGGIVPSYAVIAREYFSPREAGTRVGIVIMATVVGMALGGWMSGKIFDLTGSYQAAFANGVAWDLLNASIAFWLLFRRKFIAQRTPVSVSP